MSLLRTVPSQRRTRVRRSDRILHLELLEPRLLLASFTVTSAADDGAGTLRQVIKSLDRSTDPANTVSFDIGSGPQTISLQSPLPPITVPVFIDGTSQPGYSGSPLIQIDGLPYGVQGDGLTLGPGSDGSTIQGLDIYGFKAGSGIDVQSNSNVIQDNYLGTDSTGKNPEPNQTGLRIDNASSNSIGVGTVQQAALDFSQGFGNAGSQIMTNGSATIQNNRLRLTDGGPYESRSAFATTAVDVTNFTTSFEFQISGTELKADGFTFCIQGVGPGAIYSGGYGGGLGYGSQLGAGIPRSVAIKFDLYNNAGEGTDSTGIYTDGAAPTVPAVDLSGTGINLHSGDVFLANMSYDGQKLAVTITDTVTNQSASQSYPIDIPQVVGNSTAYVGFTAGTGLYTATQEILNWTFLTPVGRGNVISGNSVGVAIEGDSTGNLLQNNKIGTDITGSSALPNATDGVQIDASNNMVGGDYPGVGNWIAFNGGAGVHVVGGDGDTIRGNSIFNNIQGGILLDPAANRGQPAPTLSSLNYDPSIGSVIQVELSGFTPNTSFDLDFYASAPGANSGREGDAQTYLGTASLQTDSNGAASGSFSFPQALPGDIAVTATATSPGGDTSPLSQSVVETGVLTVTTTADDGPGSLREAMIDALNAQDLVPITFDIPGSGLQEIDPSSPLPMIGQRLVIDATTQPGYRGVPLVLIDGQPYDLPGPGLFLASGSGGSTIKGMEIFGFSSGAGIQITSNNNWVTGDYLDIGPSADDPRPNQVGVLIDSPATNNTPASNNTIGGTAAGAGNLISGSQFDGVEIEGNSTTGNSVEDNIITTNSGDGVFIGLGTSNNTIGGSVEATIGGSIATDRNVISGNASNGVDIEGYSNTVEGNYIGTDSSGSTIFGNASNGVLIGSRAFWNTIGGLVGGARNIISGNASNGVDIEGYLNTVEGNYIGTDYSGSSGLPNASNGVLIGSQLFTYSNTIGGSVGGARNVISGNANNGVDIEGPLNSVEGNYIGTNSSGSNVLPNATNGVSIESRAFSNTIGGSVGGARNVISGNANNGVDIEGPLNSVEGNYIGTNSSGSSVFPNATNNGVLIESTAYSNTIGGSVGGARNIISGNASNGVDIEGHFNYVEGNYVGTDSTGELTTYSGIYSLGNRVGVLIDGSYGNVVGVFTPINGSVQGLRNVISGNSEAGVEITNEGAGNEVEGNYVGTNAEGTSTVNQPSQIPLGNETGVLINGGANNNTIGGTTPAAGNVISSNFGAGVDISGFAFFGEVPTSSNLVAGNDIGTDKTGTKEMGNGVGVRIEAGARNNTLGGTVRGAPNVITHNYHDGVDVLGTDTSANQILGTDTSANQILGNIIAANLANGVHLSGAGATDNTIADNTIGLDASGNLAGNAVDGILADKGATGNTIGGSTETDYNIIAGNQGAGVHITDSATTKNRVQGNFIGTDSSGKKSIGNGTGVLINDSTENTIGGTINGSTNPANVIGGNGVGIEISGFNSSLIGPNFIEGNCIGVTEAEDGSPIGNVYGIWINDVPNNMVGGPAQDERNTISDNTSAGVYISGPDATGNLVEGNSILGPNNKGIRTDPTNPLPIGVFIQNSSSNTIGGAGAGGNTIYGNNVGIYIVASGGSSTDNQVLGNFIGLSANGGSRFGNVLYGVILVNAPNNNVPQSGPSANKIVGSGIANFREFSGPVATTQPSSSGRGSGSSAKKPAHHSNHVAHQSPRRTALHAQVTVHGHTVPAGPLRNPRARVRHCATGEFRGHHT